MARLRQRFVITSLIVAGVASCLVIPTPKTALAWSGDLSPCDLTGFDIVSSWESNSSTSLDSSSSFVVFKRGTQTNIFVGEGSTQIRIGDPGGGNRIYVSGAEMYEAVKYNFGEYSHFTGQTSGYDDADCISYANNINYTSGGTPYPTYDLDDPPEETPPPDPTDSPTPTPTPDPPTPALTEDEAKKFAQETGITIALLISAYIIYQFRFTRHE